MASRDSLHRLIEDLPETELFRAERVLEALRETAAGPLHNLETAPEDDEPETPEEAAAVAQAWREHREGKSFSTKELKRELGLEWTPKARRDLARLDAPVQARIVAAVLRFGESNQGDISRRFPRLP